MSVAWSASSTRTRAGESSTAEQDGFAYRAVKAWTGDVEPAGPQSSPGSAYQSTLTITFDEQLRS
jgi:CspA family cold shock protein